MTSDPGADSGAQADEQTADGQAPDTDGTPRKRKRKHARKQAFWRDLVVIVVAALALTILLKAFVVQVFSIPSGSMENTLLPGDRILVSKIVYHFRPIARGDIVVFSGSGSWDPVAQPPHNPLLRVWGDAVNLVGIAGPQTDYVKRVIGIPGDHVVCCNASGQITVNGVALSESSYIFPGDHPSDIRFNIVVPPGRLWVMGDDRGDSDDSRYRATSPGKGTIPESAVVGRAFLVIWPLPRVSDLPIPETFKQAGLSQLQRGRPGGRATGSGDTLAASRYAHGEERRRCLARTRRGSVDERFGRAGRRVAALGSGRTGARPG